MWIGIKLLVTLVIWAPVPAVGLLAAWYGQRVQEVLAPDEIAIATADVPSRVWSARGLQIGGLERGARPWVPFEDISDDFVRALVASEDQRFFYHQGFDLEAIARAAVANRDSGGVQQGGSTITQQLAKSFVGDEATFARKIDELIVARRLEVRFSKRAIFESYANRVYFGAGATGVDAAAGIYFGIRAADLSLAQSATLVAVLPAPGRFNPFVRPEVVVERRDRVLRRLEVTGMASTQEVESAIAEPLVLSRTADTRVVVPGVERAVWRALDAMAPGIDWRRGARDVRTGIDVARQRRAERAMRTHIEALDRRQGSRGPIARVLDVEAFDVAALEAALEAAAGSGRLWPVRVLEVARDYVTIVSAGESERVPSSGWAWAVPWRADAGNHDGMLDDARDTFEADTVWLYDGERLSHWPRVEGAYVAADTVTGLVEAHVIGYDARRTQFDRVVQACRQPGSTFKPVVYSAALDSGFTVASPLRDSPIRIRLGPFEEWRPRNADSGFRGHLTLMHALTWSRNLPALELYGRLGSAATIIRARQLGIESPLDAVESLALGASCLAPVELLRVYGTFARFGVAFEERIVEHVADSSGVVVSAPAPEIPWAPASDMIGRVWTARRSVSRYAIDPVTAFQMSWLMRQVVIRGTGSELRAMPVEIAGKTGTTNAFDAWFAGFTEREVAIAWIGSDRNQRPLGREETGGQLALPMWADALVAPEDRASPADVSQTSPSLLSAARGPVLPDAPLGIVWRDVEPESGWLAAADRWSLSMPFRIGTEPRQVAETQESIEVRYLERIERVGHIDRLERRRR